MGEAWRLLSASAAVIERVQDDQRGCEGLISTLSRSEALSLTAAPVRILIKSLCWIGTYSCS
jgi:hypothetical protein